MDQHSLECLDFFRVREILAQFALSSLGRALALGIHPVTRHALVVRWLAQVGEMQRLIEDRGTPPFAGITDIRAIIDRCAPPLRVNVEEMAQIGSTLAGTHQVAAHLQDLPADMPELLHLAGRIGDFRTVAERINGVIDERGNVRDDASPKLSRVRAEIRAAQAQIGETIDRVLREAEVRKFLQYANYTFHGDRLVLPLRADCRGRVPGIVHRASDSGATIYVEPAQIVELNNRISNLRSEEQEEIGRLLWDLAHEVHLNAKELHKTLETLAVVDLIVAKVRFAVAFDARCPQLNDDGTLSVRAARHPMLVQMARERAAAGGESFEVIAIDYRLGVDFDLLVITGPNTGGKTVTLKTVGLLALLVQAGVPVPVGPGSEFGIFSNVLIDVGDEQNMAQSLSTFSGHLKRLLEMLRHAGPRALLLIDELGAGTDPDEGAALGRAMLDELLRLHCRCVVTTHLGALKGFAYMRPRVENACVEFNHETLRPTYHLRLGEPGASNAIEIAARLGMPKRLIGAAQHNLSRKSRALHSAIEGTRVVKRQAEEARKQAEDARLAAHEIHAAAEQARTQFEQKQAEFHQWVQRVVHLQPGDAVRVRNFDRDGKIVRLRLDQQRAEVDVGMFAVEVPLGDVLPPQTPAPPARPVVAPPPPVLRPRKRRHEGPRQPQSGPGAPGSGPAGTGPRHSGDQRHGHGGGDHPGGRGPRPAPPPPNLEPLTAEAIEKLQPMDSLYVVRFRREGRFIRLIANRHLAVVNMGLFEVEVPYDGLARVRARRPDGSPRTPPRKPEPPTSAPGPESADRPVPEGLHPTAGESAPTQPSPSSDAPPA